MLDVRLEESGRGTNLRPLQELLMSELGVQIRFGSRSNKREKRAVENGWNDGSDYELAAGAEPGQAAIGGYWPMTVFMRSSMANGFAAANDSPAPFPAAAPVTVAAARIRSMMFGLWANCVS